MPELRFNVTGGEAVEHGAVPILAFRLEVSNSLRDEVIHAIALRIQIQLEVTRRKYDSNEQARLQDLFGEPDRWGQTLRSLLWTHANVIVPRFAGSRQVEVPVPCSFDFNVGATKYFHGVTSGELPLCFQFSGTVFYAGLDGSYQVAPISWEQEAKFRLPVETWKQLMDEYYPNSAWLALRKDTFEKLYRYKVRVGIPTWEEAIERALQSVPEMVSR